MFHVNVEGAVFRGDKWLIIERSQKEEHAGGLLSFAGGTVEKEGNSKDILERTLKRELLEEVGITIKPEMSHVNNTSFLLGDGSQVLNIVLLCEIDEGEPFPKAKDEVDDIYWMTTKEVLTHPRSPEWLKQSILRAETHLNKIKQCI
ncbi:NUDIX hydrolase [Bacillus sp. SG-1]|uniref:NUDIX hydrolase n=1 Tax=Bacillus sp. SG-1 TaxID=161544 RepID=UPI00015430D1|nr:NUDIX domain-containing protein [Bacillus sp. SG-1]EDL66263.1 MutT/Nudix family protein [Bacillus sp. SG-1]